MPITTARIVTCKVASGLPADDVLRWKLTDKRLGVGDAHQCMRSPAPEQQSQQQLMMQMVQSLSDSLFSSSQSREGPATPHLYGTTDAVPRCHTNPAVLLTSQHSVLQ